MPLSPPPAPTWYGCPPDLVKAFRQVITLEGQHRLSGRLIELNVMLRDLNVLITSCQDSVRAWHAKLRPLRAELAKLEALDDGLIELDPDAIRQELRFITMGIRRFVLWDPDQVEPRNVASQLLFRPRDLYRPKVEVARPGVPAGLRCRRGGHPPRAVD